MGLFDIFSKGGKYFGKSIAPRCEYCEYGKRASDGNKVLCSKNGGLVDAGYHCIKFTYSPLKRIPEKQMKKVGWLEGDYDEKNFDEIAAKRAKAAKKAAEEAEAAKKAEEEAKKAEEAKKTAAAKSAPKKSAPQKEAPKTETPKNDAADTKKPNDKQNNEVKKPAAEKTEGNKSAATEVKKSAIEGKTEPNPVTAPKAEEKKPADAPKAEAVKKPAVKSVVANDLASLAAAAEASGEYNPESAASGQDEILTNAEIEAIDAAEMPSEFDGF